MRRWVLGAIVVLGAILYLGLNLGATPIEVTTQGKLFFALDQACTKAEQLQTASQVLCNQVKERFAEKLQRRLQNRGSIRLDPDLLGEVLGWVAQWNLGNSSEMGADQALQLAVGLTELVDQGAYGEKLHELLAYGQAADYTPEEMTLLVTRLAEMTTTETPAGNVLDKALGHLDKALLRKGPEKVLEVVQQKMSNNIPGIAHSTSGFGDDEQIPSIEESNAKSERGPALGYKSPSNREKTAQVAASPAMDKEQRTGSGPKVGHHPPSDRGEEVEISTSPTTEEEEDEGVPQQGRHHKKGQSEKGK